MLIDVLLVEDNPGDRRLIQEALKEAGHKRFRLDCADGLARGLERLSTHTPDVVLLDLSLPDCQGLATFNSIHTQAPEVPTVVLTGLKDEEVALQAMRAGAQDYLFKGDTMGEALVRALLYAIERNRMEAALKSERRRLLDVLETVPSMVCLLKPDYHVAFANRSFRKKFGESNGRHCYEYCCGRKEPCDFCESFEVLKTGRPHHWEAITPEGPVIDVHDFPFTDVDGSTMILKVDIDITERKRTEELRRKLHDELEQRVKERTAALREANERLQVELAERQRAEAEIRESRKKFQDLVETTNDFIWEVDPQGRYTYCSPRMEELWGIKSEEMLGKTPFDVMPAEHRSSAAESFAEIAKSPRPFCGLESAAYVGQGRLIYVETNGVPFFDENGKLRGFRGISRDITERKRTGAALRESEERFRVAQELSPDGFSILRPVRDANGQVMDFTWVYANPAMERIVAMPLASLAGRSLLETFPGHRGSAFLDAYRQVAETGQTSIQEALYQDDGVLAERWFRVAVVPMGQDIAVLSQDITARKRAETRMVDDLAALKRMHALSARLLGGEGLTPLLQEAMDAAVAIMRAERGTLQVLENGSLRILAHHGHQRPFLEFFASAEHQASVCGQAMHLNERVIVPDVEKSSLFAGTPSLAVLREAGVRAVQSTPIVSRTGALLGILTTQWSVSHSPDPQDLWRIDLLARQTADLIYRAQAEEALRASEQRFRVLAEAMPQLVWSTDATGAIDYINPRTIGYTGSPVEGIYGWNWMSFLHAEDSERTASAWRLSVKTGAPYRIEHRIRRADGEFRWHLTIAVPVCDESGQIMRWIGTATDIHDQKTAEQTLEQRVLERTAELNRVNRALRTISECSQALARAQDEPELLHDVCRTMVEVGGYEAAWVGFAEQDEARTVRPAAFAGADRDVLEGLKITWSDTERGRGPTGTALRTGKYAICRNLQEDSRYAPWHDVVVQRGLTSSISMPLILDGRPSAALTLYSRTADAFERREVELLDELANDLAFGIQALRNRAERRKAEEALRRQADQYTTLVATTKDGYWLIDEEARLLDVNEAYCRMSGYTRDELLTLTIPEIEASETPEEVVRHMQKVMKSGFNRFETRHRRKDGTVFDVEVSVSYWREAGRFLLFANDITRRKQGQEALRRSEHNLAEAQRIAHLGSWDWDLAKETALWSKELFQIHGIASDAGEVRLETAGDFVPPDDRERIRTIFEEAIREGKSYTAEHRIVRPDGEVRFVVSNGEPVAGASGKPIRMTGTVQDITERKRAEEEIRHLSARLLQTQEEERRRIARELHDSTAQGLAAIAINLSVVQGSARMNEKVRKCLASAVDLAKECSEEVRNISHLLHPHILEVLGLSAAVNWYVSRFSERTGIAVDVEASPELGRLGEEMETALFRIVQEGLTNVYRHSGSSRAKIELVRDSVAIRLRIADEGRGAASAATGRQPSPLLRPGLGIPAMRERVRQFGGKFEIRSGKAGTAIRVALPLPKK